MESLTSYEHVMKIIESNGKISFSKFPEDIEYIINLRERVNKEIDKLTEKK